MEQDTLIVGMLTVLGILVLFGLIVDKDFRTFIIGALGITICGAGFIGLSYLVGVLVIGMYGAIGG